MTDNGNWLRLAAALCLSGASLCAPAQIYKYQDEQGKWHFTDRPPPTLTDVEVVGQGARRSSAPSPRGMRERSSSCAR